MDETWFSMFVPSLKSVIWNCMMNVQKVYKAGWNRIQKLGQRMPLPHSFLNVIQLISIHTSFMEGDIGR